MASFAFDDSYSMFCPEKGAHTEPGTGTQDNDGVIGVRRTATQLNPVRRFQLRDRVANSSKVIEEINGAAP